MGELRVADDCGSWGQTADVVLNSVGMADVVDDVADGVNWIGVGGTYHFYQAQHERFIVSVDLAGGASCFYVVVFVGRGVHFCWAISKEYMAPKLLRIATTLRAWS